MHLFSVAILFFLLRVISLSRYLYFKHVLLLVFNILLFSIYRYRAVGSFFVLVVGSGEGAGGGPRGLSKNSSHHGWSKTKNKIKHWLKIPKAVPKISKLSPKYKRFKVSDLELFSGKYYLGHTTLLFLCTCSSGYHQSFCFLISDCLAESLKPISVFSYFRL